MKNALVTVMINMISLWILEMIIPGIRFDGTWQLLRTAAALGILNSFIKPLLKVLSFPITLLTFGLFSFVINGLILQWSLSLGTGASQSLYSSVIAAIVLGLINRFVSRLLEKE